MGYFLGACYIISRGLWKSVAMRQFIPPLVLFLIACGFWLSDKPSIGTAGSGESSVDIATADTEVAKKKADTKDPEEAMVSEDIFPQKYLTNWKTYEGLLSLMRAPEGEAIQGVYFHPVRHNEVRGTIVASHMSTRSSASLTGFWFQPVSDKKCNFEKNGTYYWGRLSFVFKGNSFKGIWGYCGDEADYSWNGKRV